MESYDTAGPAVAERTPAGSVVEATLFVRRLRRLVGIRREHGARMNAQGLRLLDHAIYSTFCDCRDQGRGDEANVLIHQIPAVP